VDTDNDSTEAKSFTHKSSKDLTFYRLTKRIENNKKLQLTDEQLFQSTRMALFKTHRGSNPVYLNSDPTITTGEEEIKSYNTNR